MEGEKKQMSKHTPGPWKTTHSEVNGYRVSDSTGWGVAVVLKDTNDEANARLIAAAPQMLEALQTAFDLLKEYQSMYQHPDNIDPEIDEIEAVLMAAKGEV